jgi:2-dehydro-3-deoxy-D-arabinonate dehydratase
MGAFAPRGWRLVRLQGEGAPRLGAIDPAAPATVRELRERDALAALRRGLARCAAEAVDEHVADDPARLSPLPLLTPLFPGEIWAAGVTYERSRHARVEESESSADVYALVYDAERPELFLKDAGCRRTVGPNQPVAVRSESRWTVPEPELGLVLDADGSIMAVTAGNDLTARDIEAENPLYLPQAKLFSACCALGPAILVPDDPAAPYAISIRIWNAEGALVNEDATSTSAMHRSFEELATWCVRENPLPAGSVLLTGTGVVPPDDVALAPGYRVEVEVEGVGVLANPVRAA